MSISGISSTTASIPVGYTSQCGDTSSCDKTEKLEKQHGTKSDSSEKGQELTREEQQQVKELQKRDQEVRTHEMAHIAAGGQYVRGGAHYEYQTGPDGKRYAVGGEVSIDTSSVSDDPQATVQKMQVIRKAALAPANPSAKDRAVAAAASQKLNKAKQEQVQERKETLENESAKQTGDHHTVSKKTAGYTDSGSTISINRTDSAQLINIKA